MKQLGCYIYPDIHIYEDMCNMDQLVEKLPKEVKNILEGESNRAVRLLELAQPLEQKVYEIKIDISKIKDDIEEIKNDIVLIKRALGIRDKLVRIEETMEINMMKRLDDILYENLSLEQILKKPMSEQVTETRVMIEEIKKWQEIINSNLWTIFEIINKKPKFKEELEEEQHEKKTIYSRKR